MKTTIFILASILVLCTGCKKTYTCACKNPGGSTDIFTQKSSKSDAKSKCKDYYKSTFGHIPMNETSCEIK